MADILPFRGLYYDRNMVGDLSRIICPPYDIISPQQQQDLYARSEYNSVRLELARELPQDAVGNNRYTRAADTLDDWLNRGILRVDERPAIYLHDHYFQFGERKHRRRGIVARVRLEEWEERIVRPHEGTLAGPRRDRLDLLWALRANTSPALSMFEDPEQHMATLLEREASHQPMMRVSDPQGERHDIWAITDENAIERVTGLLSGQPLYIADGHHRYTSALTYRRERRSYSSPPLSGDQPFDFVMMTLVDIADPGLLVLPPHRMVRGIPRSIINGLMDNLAVFFDIDTLPLNSPDIWQRLDKLLAEQDGTRIAGIGMAADNLVILNLKDSASISSMIPSFHTTLFRHLDVSIIDHVILEKLLGIDSAGDEIRVHYSHDRQDAVRRVLDQEYQMVFFLSPIEPVLVKTVADLGETMPRKSTYFYPKTPVGLISHRLE